MRHRVNRALVKRGLIAIALGAMLVAPGIALAADVPAAHEKDETVYVRTAADGSVKSIEVSTLLRNPDEAASLGDASILSDIKGKDDKTYSGSGESIVWNAQGADVTYTGTTTMAAPVSLHASYTLDGQPISPDDLAGKSGHVTIRYDFTNHSARTATVNGASQTIYTPFTCITALMFDGKDFKNVAVENGKVVNDGDDIIVAGYAVPGLKESLGSMASDSDVPEHFTVSTDVTNFDLKSSMTIVTAGLMTDFNAESLGIEGVDDASALTDAMGQLISGSEQITSGLDALAEGLKQVETGAAGIHEGAETLSGGLYALAGDSGLGYLASGAYSLSSAVGLIGDSVGTMKGELQAASAALAHAASAAPAYEAAMATMASNKDKIVSDTGMSEGDYEQVVGALATAKESSTALSAIAAGLDEGVTKLDELKAGITNLKDQAAQLGGGIYGAADRTRDLADGASTLESYAAQMSQSMPTLVQGAEAAADGSKTLTQGMRTFNEQGVSELVSTLQDKYGGMLDRMNALSDAAKSYTNFAGIAEGTKGSVKFVYQTDAITRD